MPDLYLFSPQPYVIFSITVFTNVYFKTNFKNEISNEKGQCGSNRITMFVQQSETTSFYRRFRKPENRRLLKARQSLVQCTYVFIRFCHRQTYTRAHGFGDIIVLRVVIVDT